MLDLGFAQLRRLLHRSVAGFYLNHCFGVFFFLLIPLQTALLGATPIRDIT